VEHVGIDLGRRQSQLCRLTADGEIRHQRVATTREALAKALGAGHGKVLLEASTISEWVARHLESLGGWEVIVADPNFAPMYAERTRRVKTDRRDAEALMNACLKGNHQPAHRLSDEARQRRATVMTRKTLVRMRAKLVAQTRCLIAAHGLALPTGSTEGFPRRWEEAAFPEEVAAGAELLVEAISMLRPFIDKAEKELQRLGRDDEAVRRLMSVPGVGPVTAVTWVATLDTPRRFQNGEHVVSYIGLVPREWSSSEVRLQGRITKMGPVELRDLLVEAAWSVLTHESCENETLRNWALGVAARRGRRRAVIALARRLARVMFVIWRDGTSYVPEKTMATASSGA
jgi:transposase